MQDHERLRRARVELEQYKRKCAELNYEIRVKILERNAYQRLSGSALHIVPHTRGPEQLLVWTIEDERKRVWYGPTTKLQCAHWLLEWSKRQEEDE